MCMMGKHIIMLCANAFFMRVCLSVFFFHVFINLLTHAEAHADKYGTPLIKCVPYMTMAYTEK